MPPLIISMRNHLITYFFKILLRLWKGNNFIKRISDAYFEKILLQTNDDYDYVIVLKGESLDRKKFIEIQKINIRTLNSFITHGILLKTTLIFKSA